MNWKWTSRRSASARSRLTAHAAAALLALWAASAGASSGTPPLPSHDGTPVFRVAPIDPVMALAAAKDAESKVGAPLPFARPTAVRITPKDHGRWERGPGGASWRLRIEAPGATDLNFGFQRFVLPPGAELYFLAHDPLRPGHHDGPYGAADAHQGAFWSGPQPGDSVTIVLFIPEDAATDPDLLLHHVGAGFRDIHRLRGGPGLAKQGSCNNDVACPEGDAWRDPIRAVAAYTVAGTDACSGTMIMDAEGTFTPWFLTAFHCGINVNNDESVVTIFNYESPTCGDLGGGSRLDTVSGATLRAARQDVDVALLELSSTPPAEFNVHYAGWDRSDLTPPGSVAIHHPGVDEKAISFNDDPLFRDASCILAGNSGDTHWVVDDWEDGTTERGSSGSGLFEPTDKRLIGFLSGGLASCTNTTGFDCYGRFAIAWLGGASDTQRLAPWLDPGSTGTLAVDGADPGPFRVEADDTPLRVCPGEPVSLPVSVTANGPVPDDPISLALSDAPAGVDFGFAPAAVQIGGVSTLTLLADETIETGSYVARIVASAPVGSDANRLHLTVPAPVSNAPTLVVPGPSDLAVGVLPELLWTAVLGAESYFVELAVDPQFEGIVEAVMVSTNRHVPTSPLASATTYYWRVTATTGCADAKTSEPSQFTTGTGICSAPALPIPDGSVDISALIDVPDQGVIEDLDVFLEIDHSAIGDLVVTLKHEDSGQDVTLIDQPGAPEPGRAGCLEDDMQVTLDDEADDPVGSECAPSPALRGRLRPQEPLAGFDETTLTGRWRLTVADRVALDTGTLVRWCLQPALAGGSTVDDHGDAPAAATRIDLDQAVPGRLEDERDDDYFRLFVPSRGTLRVFTTGPTDTAGRIQDGDNTRLAANDNQGEDRNFGFNVILDPRAYFVRVRGSDGNYGPYVLRTSFTPDPAANDDHGPSPALATRIDRDDSVTGMIDFDRDNDWFRIFTDAPGLIAIRTTGGTDTAGRIINGDGAVLASRGTGGEGGNFAFEVALPERGTYFLKVRAQDRTPGPYQLELTFTAGDP